MCVTFFCEQKYEADCISLRFCEVVELKRDLLVQLIKESEADYTFFMKTQNQAKQFLTVDQARARAAATIQRAWRKHIKNKRQKRRVSIFSNLIFDSMTATDTQNLDGPVDEPEVISL